MAISSKSKYYIVWKSFLLGRYTLCVSNEIIEEYLEVIGRNLNASMAINIVITILTRKNVKRVDPHFRFNLIEADKDDNKFVDCAIASNARFIVTEDHHFGILRQIPFPKILVININEFVSILE